MSEREREREREKKSGGAARAPAVKAPARGAKHRGPQLGMGGRNRWAWALHRRKGGKRGKQKKNKEQRRLTGNKRGRRQRQWVNDTGSVWTEQGVGGERGVRKKVKKVK